MADKNLFDAVRAWLDEQQLSAEADVEAKELHFRVTGRTGEWACRLICEESPLLLQLLCWLPFRVPEVRQTAAAVLLHEVNSAMRLGAFGLDAATARISFRLSMPVRNEAPMPAQINLAVATGFTTVDDAFGPLAEFAFSGCTAEHTLRQLGVVGGPSDLLPARRIAGPPGLN